MNLPYWQFAVFVATSVLLAWRLPRYLFALWVLVLLVLPSGRTLIGGAPFYWYDAAALLVLARLYCAGELRYWPAAVPRWHYWFVAIGVLIGTLVPMVRYGFTPEMIWILGHASIAWMAYPMGLALYVSPRAQEYRRSLGYGLVLALGITAVIAALEFGSPARAAALNSFFFHDMRGQVVMIDNFGAALSASRVNGPHGDPNTLGGTTAIVCAICLLLFDERRRRWLSWTAAGFAAVIVAATVSRQVLVAAAVASLVVMTLGRARGRVRVVVAAAIVAVAALGSGVAANWTHRLSKWEGGVQQDTNVVGRVIIGPMRTITLIERDPSVLLVGTGLDLQKLQKKAVDKADDIGIYGTGFVSNSFLLPLYYLGIAGFVVTLWLWIWTLRKAFVMPRATRALDVACVIATMALIASDNYATVVKPTVASLFLLAGIVAGRWVNSSTTRSATSGQSSRFFNIVSAAGQPASGPSIFAA